MAQFVSLGIVHTVLEHPNGVTLALTLVHCHDILINQQFKVEYLSCYFQGSKISNFFPLRRILIVPGGTSGTFSLKLISTDSPFISVWKLKSINVVNWLNH